MLKLDKVHIAAFDIRDHAAMTYARADALA